MLIEAVRNSRRQYRDLCENKMRRVAFLVSACLLLSACDQSKSDRTASSSSSAESTTYETVRGLAEGQSEQVMLNEVSDPTVIEAAAQQVSASGYSCTEVQQLWKLAFKKNVGMTILKVRCSGGVEYQLTLFDNKGFVKLWTGVLMGN